MLFAVDRPLQGDLKGSEAPGRGGMFRSVRSVRRM